MKQIGILTFQASHNYGYMLQAYALQTYLQRLGYIPIIINLRKPIQKQVYAPTLLLSHPKSCLFRLFSRPLKSIMSQQKWNRFENFLEKVLNTSVECSDCDGVSKIIDELNIDTIIVGSDQIWNTACLDFDESFLLPFNQLNRKVAYAPSMGPDPEAMTVEYKKVFEKMLATFDFISVREERSSSFISQILGKEIPVVADPTLLIGEEDYEQLYGATSIIKEDYIFYYSPIDKPEAFEKVVLLSEYTGMKVVVTQDNPYYKWKNIEYVYNCGPRQFLNLIKYANITCGKSFHLLVFSLLLKKDFYTIEGDTDSRLNNLLKISGLLNRNIKITDISVKTQSPVDYESVEKRLDILKKKSVEFLWKSLTT